MSVKVLLVEDEKSIAEGIIYNLKNEGFKLNSYIIHTEYEFKSR